MFNERNACATVNSSTFAKEMTYLVIIMLEGASMGILMAFHFVNFKHGTLLSSQQDCDGGPAYASIKLGEYHFFTDEEVD